jgi:hypothetical protein
MCAHSVAPCDALSALECFLLDIDEHSTSGGPLTQRVEAESKLLVSATKGTNLPDSLCERVPEKNNTTSNTCAVNDAADLGGSAKRFPTLTSYTKKSSNWYPVTGLNGQLEQYGRASGELLQMTETTALSHWELKYVC